jgi:hypothetical protein
MAASSERQSPTIGEGRASPYYSSKEDDWREEEEEEEYRREVRETLRRGLVLNNMTFNVADTPAQALQAPAEALLVLALEE